jgi:hypothetical protein
MNRPTFLRDRRVAGTPVPITGSGFDEHLAASARAQKQADRWLIAGSLLIGTAALGVLGLPLFLRGVWLLRRAQRDGLSVRPMLVTLLGYLVIIAAAIGFLQMKRWGQQWMIVTCWMGVLIWCLYVFNMTMYADVRFAGVVLPVIGWWLYDIFYITPFLAIPYLHTVNREIFTD